MNLNKFCSKYENRVIRDDGCVNSAEMKQFGRDFRSALKDFCKKNLFELCSFNIGHYDIFAFVKNPKNKYIYINYSVPRGNYPINIHTSNCFGGVLYREAENEKDYKGKGNHYSSFSGLENSLLFF